MTEYLTTIYLDRQGLKLKSKGRQTKVGVREK